MSDGTNADENPYGIETKPAAGSLPAAADNKHWAAKVDEEPIHNLEGSSLTVAEEAAAPTTSEAAAESTFEEPPSSPVSEPVFQEPVATNLPIQRVDAPTLQESFAALGQALDLNAAHSRDEFIGLREEVRNSMDIMLTALNTAGDKEAEINHLKTQIVTLSTDVQQLDEFKKAFAKPPGLTALLDWLDEERQETAFAFIHLLSCIGTAQTFSVNFLAGVVEELGSLVHRAPQPPSDILDRAADELNAILQGGENSVSIKRVRRGEPIDLEVMDGADIQGKRSVGEVHNWAVQGANGIIRQAQISG